MNDLTNEHFGRKLREERAQRGWSINEASRQVHVSYKTWQRIENGLAVQDKLLLKIEEALGLKPGTAHAMRSGEVAWPTPKAVTDGDEVSVLSALEQGRTQAADLSDDKATAYGYLLAVVDTVIQQLRTGGAS